MEPISQKFILDLVAAILSNRVLGKDGASASPKEAAKTFYQVRDELIKAMSDSESGQLPVFLANKFPKSTRR